MIPMSTTEFAAHVGATPSEVRALIHTGVLPAEECGGRFLLDPERIEAEAPGVWATLVGDADADAEDDNIGGDEDDDTCDDEEEDLDEDSYDDDECDE